jgi:CRP/FNR family transcriptional regulator, nitrogen fixation regulation protein
MLKLRGHIETRPNEGPGTILKFRKGEIVYAQGDPATAWFEVLAGTVRTCLLYSDGHRQLTGFFYTGDVFGIDSGYYASSAEAVTAVSLRRCGRGFGEDLQADNAPPVHGALRNALTSAQACISLLGRRTAAERLAAFAPNQPFALPMSRADIADHLGLTIHTVSRTLSEFVRRALISLDGPQSVMIHDYSALRRICDGDDDADLPIKQIPPHANLNGAQFASRYGS